MKIIELDTGENGDVWTKVVEFSSIMIKETSGVGGGFDSYAIGDPCGPDSEVFYDFGEEIMTQVLVKRILRAIARSLWEIGNQSGAISTTGRWIF